MKQILTILFIVFFFSACVTKHFDKTFNNKTQEKKLENMIISIYPNINKSEAKSLAYEAINHSKHLAKKYETVSPALLQNTLINLGIKERGLCFHYANDLLTFLEKKDYKSFKFVKVVANRGEYFEHTAFILTDDHIDFKNSIIFDAWRDSGNLFFSKIKNDKKYKWEIK